VYDALGFDLPLGEPNKGELTAVKRAFFELSKRVHSDKTGVDDQRQVLLNKAMSIIKTRLNKDPFMLTGNYFGS
jgi:hypothetical protein